MPGRRFFHALTRVLRLSVGLRRAGLLLLWNLLSFVVHVESVVPWPFSDLGNVRDSNQALLEPWLRRRAARLTALLAGWQVALFGGIPGAMNTMYSVLIINEGGNSRLAAVLVGFFVLGTRQPTQAPTNQRYRTWPSNHTPTSLHLPSVVSTSLQLSSVLPR